MTLERQIRKIIKKIEDEKRLGDKRAEQLFSIIPIGSIFHYMGGYFTNSSNGGFVMVMADDNTVAEVNALLNPFGGYVCNGAALNIPNSPIFNAAGRYLPNISDYRFICGSTTAGGSGGSSSSAHTHVVGTYVNAAEAAHTHAPGTLAATHKHIAPIPDNSGKVGRTDYFGSAGAVSCTYNYVAEDGYTTASIALHYTSEVSPTFSGATAAGSSHTHTLSGSSGAASSTENRPKFLNGFYIMRVF